MKSGSMACVMAVVLVPGVWGLSAWDRQATPVKPGQPATPAAGADTRSERLVVPWSDPARPGTLHVSVMQGDITVRGYDGKDVIVETSRRDETDRDEIPPPAGSFAHDKKATASSARPRARASGGSAEADDVSGLRRIPNLATGLSVEEENNVMRVNAPMMRGGELGLVIQVPRRTSLKLSGVNDGAIVVENVDGEIEANQLNGPVTLTNVAGSVVAHALNDDLTVKMARVSGKPMSFSSMNGDIDVTLPADLKANVRLETVQGEILTDFDLVMQPTAAKQTVQDRKEGGRYRVSLERAMTGTINGGGPEISFKNFNGDIRIRKAK